MVIRTLREKLPIVLVSVRINFFKVAGTGLCVGFILESAGNTGMALLLLSSAHTEPRPILLLPSPHPTPPARGLGVHKELGGVTTRQLTLTDPNDIADHMVSCKAGEEERRRGHLE